MPRITITLTEEEYGDLERLALAERRSVRDMAAYLVTRPRPAVTFLPAPYTQPVPMPSVWPPNVICGPSDGTSDVKGPNNSYVLWNGGTSGRFQ